MSRTVRILGIGSPHGDDRAGWEVIRLLQEQPLDGIEVRALAQPVELLDFLDADTLILVDACRSGAPPGTIHRLGGETSLEDWAGASTHGVGVGTALALARSLGRRLPCIVLRGIEEASAGPGEDLSPAVRDALPEFSRRVLDEARRERERIPSDE